MKIETAAATARRVLADPSNIESVAASMTAVAISHAEEGPKELAIDGKMVNLTPHWPTMWAWMEAVKQADPAAYDRMIAGAPEEWAKVKRIAREGAQCE